MGMAASQVRFLSLQHRKNTIGVNMMTLTNRRTSLSNEMDKIAANYTDAINHKILKWSNDSGVTYNALSYDLLMKPNALNSDMPYIVTDETGKVIVDDSFISIDGVSTGMSYKQLASMISSSGEANNLYEIVSTATDNTSLRYQLLDTLGLVDKDTSRIDEIKAEIGTDNDSGEFNITSATISGGTLAGNLALAQAYKKEYEAYLNTPVTISLVGNESTQTLKNYDSETGTGISDRIITVAKANGANISKTVDGAKYTTASFLSNLAFDIESLTTVITNNAGDNEVGSNLHKGWYLYNNSGNNSEFEGVIAGDLGTISGYTNKSDFSYLGTWEELYNTSYSKNTAGELLVQNVDVDGSAGVTLMFYDAKNKTIQNAEMNISDNCAKKYIKVVNVLLENLSNQMKNNGADSTILNLAMENTKELYGVSETDEKKQVKAVKAAYTFYGDITDQAAAGKASDCYGLVTNSSDRAFVNLSNLANAFITFYNMQQKANTSNADKKINHSDQNDIWWNDDKSYKIKVDDKGSSKTADSITVNPPDNNNYLAKLTNLVSECESKLATKEDELKKVIASYDNKIMSFFDAIFTAISKNGWKYDENISKSRNENADDYLQSKFLNNQYFITEAKQDDDNFMFSRVMANNCSKIFEVYDSNAAETAQSVYETKKSEINVKEKEIDNEMNKLETEESAINTELESIKSVMNDNINSTFKMFL